MLQQTRVAAVIPYYEKFLLRFPDIQTLAAAPLEDVLRLWSGLGYYSRARNLQSAAQQIVAKHGGKFPKTRQDALALAGIGEYTASAILSIAFDDPHAVLDGNVARVLARLQAVCGELREPKRWRALQASADQLLARESPGDWNQAMMELGATVCTPRSPQCLLCPVSQFCEARKLGIAETLPEKRKKRAIVAVRLASVVLLDPKNNSLLLPPPAAVSKNKPDDHIPSLVAKLWHFPTISVPTNAEHALQQLLRRELCITKSRAAHFEQLQNIRHTVTYRTIFVSAFLLRVRSLPTISGARLLPLEQVTGLPISNLTRKITRRALQHLSGSHSTR